MKKVGDTMKKLIITLSKVLIILIVITFLLTTYTNASDIVSSMAGYEFHGNNGEIRTMGQKVIGVIQVIGVAISVIMLVVLAVRFMLAAPDGKAEVKKTAYTICNRSIYILWCNNIIKHSCKYRIPN